jgi:hypothetical protein
VTWGFVISFIVIEKDSRLIFKMLKSNIFYKIHKLPNNSTKWNMKRYDIGIRLKRWRSDDSNNSFEDLYVEREQYSQDWSSYPWVSGWKYSCNLFRLFSFLNISSFFCKMCVWVCLGCLLVAQLWGGGAKGLTRPNFLHFPNDSNTILSLTTNYIVFYLVWKPELEWVEQHNLVGHIIQGLVATLDCTMINFSLILLLKTCSDYNWK